MYVHTPILVPVLILVSTLIPIPILIPVPLPVPVPTAGEHQIDRSSEKLVKKSYRQLLNH